MDTKVFTVAPMSCKGHSLIQWNEHKGLPSRSLQVETEIAHLWAASPAMYALLQGALNNLNRLGDVRSAYRMEWVKQASELLAKVEGA